VSDALFKWIAGLILIGSIGLNVIIGANQHGTLGAVAGLLSGAIVGAVAAAFVLLLIVISRAVIGGRKDN
jgi:hypothetical protein